MKRPVALVVVWLVGCGAGNTSPSPDLAMPSSIGVNGGQVTEADGSGVLIPSGALTAAATITVTAAPTAPAPSSATVVGSAYTFGPEGQQFAAPVTVTLAITPSKIPSGKSTANVVVFTAPVGSSTYTQLTTKVVDATHVSAQVSHFSSFVPGVSSLTTCVTSSDCGTGVCVSGVCSTTCVTSADCAIGVCTNGVCK